MSDLDGSDRDLQPWPVADAVKHGPPTSSPTTRGEDSPWSCLTLALGVVLFALTIACCAAINEANRPSSGSGVAPPPSILVTLAIPPLLIVAGLLALILGGRVRLRLVGIVMATVIVGTWGSTWISNASKTYTSPEIVGVISAVDVKPDGTEQVRLADGRVLELWDSWGANTEARNTSGRYSPLVSYPPPAVGNLLLAGGRPTPWYVTTAPPIHSGSKICYTVNSNGWISGERVRLEIGLELANGVGAWFPSGYFEGWACLDDSGTVVEIITFDY